LTSLKKIPQLAIYEVPYWSCGIVKLKDGKDWSVVHA
jgi:hypothetical protein